MLTVEFFALNAGESKERVFKDFYCLPQTTGILCDNHVVRFTAPGRCLFSEQANDTQSLSLTEIDDNNK